MANEVQRFEQYISAILPFTDTPYAFEDKERCIHNHILYMLNRTHSMFRWENLPETITPRIIELYLQTNGNLCFYKYNDELFVFTGGLGGKPDVYYMPTEYVVSNPALNFSKNLKIDKECVVVSNDSMYVGMLPLFRKYATMLTENELSMKIATINSRIISLLSAPDDRTMKSAEKYLEDIAAGKQGIIAENSFLDGIRSQPIAATSNTNFLTNLIEFEQYCKASFFNAIGLDANYNMKRESLNSAESQLNNDALLPLIDDMLKCREIGAEKVNEMFGTDIRVSLASAWEDNMQEIELEHDEIENEQNEITEIEQDESEVKSDNADTE